MPMCGSAPMADKALDRVRQTDAGGPTAKGKRACVATAVVIVAAMMVAWSPIHIAASAWLSTGAMAVHSPTDFLSSRRRIWGAYALAFVLSIAVAVIASGGVISSGVSREVAVVLIMMTAARAHAPVVCVPFAVGAANGHSIAMSWMVFALSTGCYLTVLAWGAAWMTRSAGGARHRGARRG